jgi:hypothetical protein
MILQLITNVKRLHENKISVLNGLNDDIVSNTYGTEVIPSFSPGYFHGKCPFIVSHEVTSAILCSMFSYFSEKNNCLTYNPQ